MIDWFATTLTGTTAGLPMNTLSLRTWVRNAAAVSSGCYGAVTRQAEQAGCSRQTVYDHARRIEQRLQPVAPAIPPAEAPDPRPSAVLDDPTRRLLAVTAFAMGISTRQIGDRALNALEQTSDDRVSAFLRDTFRVRAAVEWINRVLPMQQSRHKRRTQPMLDLERPYRNCHRFRPGPRKDVAP